MSLRSTPTPHVELRLEVLAVLDARHDLIATAQLAALAALITSKKEKDA